MIRAATRPMAWIATKAAVCGCLALPVMSQSEGKRDQQPGGRYAVDLESEQEGGSDLLSALRLTRPWSGNITVSGFGAVAYLDTGTAGSKPDSGFMVKEASLFVEAEAWGDTFFFLEIQTNRLNLDDDLFVRTGEVHARFSNLFADELGEGALGLKIGRIDIPFGEEYLWHDASDNPMITQSVAYPYGFDEGILGYGTVKDVGWVLSVTDGNDARSTEDGDSKAFNAKLSKNLSERLYVSLSGMLHGLSGRSAFEFAGSHLEPVGVGGTSTAGSSGSPRIKANLYEVNATYSVPRRGHLTLSFGQSHLSDDAVGFDRDLSWGMVEGKLHFTDSTYCIARVSEIGTYSSSEGYHFDGKIIANGNAEFGYDTKRLQRLALGFGYKPNPMTVIKLEVGRDRFWTIDASPLDPSGRDGLYMAAELVLRF
jgi:hypothetical protein